MVIHKCDRCGAEIAGVPHSISYPDEHNIEHRGYELCDECFDSFKKWQDNTPATKTTKFPCNCCNFEDDEHCPHNCFFDCVFLNECAHNECQFSNAGGYCYFTLDCKAYKQKPLGEGINFV